MIEIELWSGSGFVAVVDLPPFQHARLPEVVTWGVRTFVRGSAPADAWASPKRPRYMEAFCAVSFTPSPGRPLNADAVVPA